MAVIGRIYGAYRRVLFPVATPEPFDCRGTFNHGTRVEQAIHSQSSYHEQLQTLGATGLLADSCRCHYVGPLRPAEGYVVGWPPS